MKWKQRLKEIEMLRAKHGRQRARPPADSLKYDDFAAPCGNRFDKIQYGNKLPAGANVFPSATLHKQGAMLLTPNMIANEMQYVGGKKV